MGGNGQIREGQTLSGESLLVRYINFVKLPHTVFALPFALLGVIVASYTHPVTWRAAILVVVAFTAARFVAMGFNRSATKRAAVNATTTRMAARQVTGCVYDATITPSRANGNAKTVCGSFTKLMY